MMKQAISKHEKKTTSRKQRMPNHCIQDRHTCPPSAKTSSGQSSTSIFAAFAGLAWGACGRGTKGAKGDQKPASVKTKKNHKNTSQTYICRHHNCTAAARNEIETRVQRAKQQCAAEEEAGICNVWVDQVEPLDKKKNFHIGSLLFAWIIQGKTKNKPCHNKLSTAIHKEEMFASV